jgi:hypothetical protein
VKGQQANALDVETNERVREAQEVLYRLEEIYLLPDEEPTVATIVNISLLQEQNERFYGNAKNGDKLVIFVENKLAIIYRFEENKIKNIAAIDFEDGDIEQNENLEVDSDSN